MTIINLEELTALIDSRIIEIVLQHNEILDKISDRVVENIANKLVSKGVNSKNTPPFDKKLPIKKDLMTGKDVQELITQKTIENLTEKLVRLATERNRNKQPYNIRKTVNYIVDNPKKEFFYLPEMIDEIGIRGTAIKSHLELLNFKFDSKSRGWVKPKKWQ